MKTLLDAKTRLMTEAESKVLMGIVIADAQGTAQVKHDELCESNFMPCLLILNNRLEAFSKAQVDPSVRILCSYLSHGSPGNAVMWAFTLHILAKKINRKISLTDFIDNFANGFPTEESETEIWESQKQYSSGFIGNLIDLKETWEKDI